LSSGAVDEINAIKQWLAPEDPVLAGIASAAAKSFSQERQQSTCLWVAPHLDQFLRGDQQVLAVCGRPGSGKSVLAAAINDHLQHHGAAAGYEPILVQICQ
jgi:putative protein kinase ArgK-like GTPase of G3E family